VAVVQEFRRDKFINISASLLTVLLFCAIILQNTELPTTLAYAMTAAVYAAIAVALAWYLPNPLRFNRRYTVLFFAFAAIVFIRTAIDPALGDAVRLVVLLSFTVVNLFVFPQLCSFRQFCNIGSRISAVLVVLGFLPYFGLTFAVGSIDLSLWGSGIYWYPDLQPMMSVFVNPNQLGGLTLFATIASIRELKAEGTFIAIPLLGLNFLGLAFSNYRTGWVAFLAAFALLIVHSLWGRRALILATIGGFCSLGFAFLLMFGILPGPEFLTEISLNGRRVLWIESVDAIFERPILGHNFSGVLDIVGNPHSTYLRIFAGFGLVGGLLYLLFLFGTIIDAIRDSVTNSQLTLAILLVAFALVQVFNQLSFIGISMRSTLIALAMGYFVTGDFRQDSKLDS
jgi:O-antigen ligase